MRSSKRQARCLVLLRDRNDESEVRLHERLLRSLAGEKLALQLAPLRRGQILRLASSRLASASRPVSMACASRTSSSLVSNGYCPMSVR